MYPYRPTTRLLSMLELLQARGRLSRPEIARRLEVSERSVRRYAEMLREMGVPVEGERGKYGAYVLRPGFKLPPMMFTDEEALALALGLLSARDLSLSGVAPAVEGALAKLERVLPGPLRERLRVFEEAVMPATVVPPTLPTRETVLTMSAAVREQKRVRVRYRSEPHVETRRELDPYAMIHGEGYWYVIGHCHLRNGRRIFRLDRVVKIEATDDIFARPPGFETSEGVLKAFATVPDLWYVEVLLETGIEGVRRRLPLLGAALEEAPGGVTMRSTTSDLRWMACVLSGLGCPFVVRTPSELRDALREHAREIAALAELTEDEIGS